jgi:hypothetical protein
MPGDPQYRSLRHSYAATFPIKAYDFSSNWITSGLPTTRTSARALYLLEIARTLLVDIANARHSDSHPGA